MLGVGDKTGTTWDGSIAVTGATILSLQGWRFGTGDSISGTTSWKLATRNAPTFVTTVGPVEENGVIVTVSSATGPVTFDVKTSQGSFSFSSQDTPFGATRPNGVQAALSFLGGKAQVLQTASPLQLTSSQEDEDFPAMAQSGDDVYLTYTLFVHGDRSKAVPLGVSTPITDFSFLARPAGGDQVMLLHYSKSQRVWTGPFPVTPGSEDVMRSAVAVDGQGRAWVIYSTQRNGNFDLYARSSRADGTMSAEIRLTSDPGTDLFPVAAADSTGRVWVAWQGFRNNNLEVLATAQTGDTFAPETIVSVSTASDWDPAIAAAPNGEVAISWDTYDKGDYDVYVRRAQFTDQIGLDDPIPIAATLSFEARSSIAYDPQSRLWIAYEVSGARWGKDFGTYDTTGIGLYQNHTIQVRCLIGNDLYTTTNDVAKVLPGQPVDQLFLPTVPGPYAPQPDPSLAETRKAGDDAAFSAIANEGPKTSFPRLATDSDGTVYLFFREPAGSGMASNDHSNVGSVGSVWVGAMVYFDGSQWHGPGVLAASDFVSENRPSILPVGPGHLLIGQATDHRLSPLPNLTPEDAGCNADVYALDLAVARTQQSPVLTKIGQVTPVAPDPLAAAEAAMAKVSRGYRPTVNGQQYQLVRGDFHRHTEISIDGGRDGPLIDAYRYAIDAASLDWAGCCDHDNGQGREYTWWIEQKFTDAYLLGSRYIPMFYAERSINYPEGHRNVMFAQRGVRNLPRLPTAAPGSPPSATTDTPMLYAYLHFFGGLTAPHTSATDQGTDWRNNDPQVEPFVEIYQGARQNYEMPGAPRDNTANDSISGFEAAGYVSVAMGKGYQLAFEASSDHISTHISYTNIWAAAPTRAAILDALRKRRVYGSTDNIVADFRSGTHFMGDSFTTSSPPVFTVRLFGTAPFQSVVVVKDNNVVYSTSGDRAVSFTWQDTAAQKGKTSYYYVRGLQQPQAGESGGQIVWASPMWVTMQ
jgi:hypothetical protein